MNPGTTYFLEWPPPYARMVDMWRGGGGLIRAACMPQVRAHAVEVLQRTEDEELLGYALQLVQALRYEAAHHSPLSAFLVARGARNPTLAIFLHWCAAPARPGRARQASAPFSTPGLAVAPSCMALTSQRPAAPASSS